MSLIKCPECQHNVSDKAKACPSCAFPLSQIKKTVKKKGRSTKNNSTKDSIKRGKIKTITVADNVCESSFSFFFSPVGRISRTHYIITMIIVVALTKLVNWAIPETAPLWIILVSWLLLCYVQIVLGIKRLHDANLSGWFSLVPIYNIIALLFFRTVSKNNKYCNLPEKGG